MTTPRLDSQTARLAWLLFPRAVLHKWLVFAVYFDDSGTHDDTATEPGSQIVAAAGYVALPNAWQAFEAAWNAFLLREGLTFYHAVDCVARSGAFAGKTNAECNRIHREAVMIITAHDLVALGFATPKAPFNEFARRARSDEVEAPPREAYCNSLYNAWRVLALYVSQWTLTTPSLLDPVPDEQVSIVVEDSPKLHEPTMRSYQAFVEEPRWQRLRTRFAGPPSFRPKLGYPQLQAADVLAYEMAVNLRRHYVPGESRRSRQSWDALNRHAVEGAQRVGLPPLVQFDTFGISPTRPDGGWHSMGGAGTR